MPLPVDPTDPEGHDPQHPEGVGLADSVIADVLFALAARRGRGATFCPSEVARLLGTDWRVLMPDVRRVAAGLPGLVATQGGVPVDPVTARGPIRLRLR